MHAKMHAMDMEIVNGENVYVNQDGQVPIALFQHVLGHSATMTQTVLKLCATNVQVTGNAV
jgi:hypothetical protein